MHPAAKMLVDLSAAQDVEAGDGTTSVVVIAGSLLGAADRLLAKGLCLECLVIARANKRKAYIPLLYRSHSRELLLPQFESYTACPSRSLFPIEPPYSKLPLRHSPQRSSRNIQISLDP